MILKRLILLTLILFVATGCSQQYVTPGEPADLNLFTVPAAKKAAAARPTASFPAYLVAVQVQHSIYSPNLSDSWECS